MYHVKTDGEDSSDNMQRKKKKVFGLKHSRPNTKKENPLVKTLQKVHTLGGTITYHFVSERIRFTKEHPDGETYQTKSVLHSDINPEVFYKTEQGGRTVRRTYEEVIQVFQEIAEDYGADHFEIG